MSVPELLSGFATPSDDETVNEFVHSTAARVFDDETATWPGLLWDQRVVSGATSDTAVVTWAVVGLRALLVQCKNKGGPRPLVYAYLPDGRLFLLSQSIELHRPKNNKDLTYPNIILEGVFARRYQHTERDQSATWSRAALTAWSLQPDDTVSGPSSLVFFAERCLVSRTFHCDDPVYTPASAALSYARPLPGAPPCKTEYGLFCLEFLPLLRLHNAAVCATDVVEPLVGVRLSGLMLLRTDTSPAVAATLDQTQLAHLIKRLE